MASNAVHTSKGIESISSSVQVSHDGRPHAAGFAPYESNYKKEPQLLPMATPRRWVYFSAAIEGAHGLAPMARARAT